MVVTGVGVNSQTGIIFTLLGAGDENSSEGKEKEEPKKTEKKEKQSKFNSLSFKEEQDSSIITIHSSGIH